MGGPPKGGKGKKPEISDHLITVRRRLQDALSLGMRYLVIYFLSNFPIMFLSFVSVCVRELSASDHLPLVSSLSAQALPFRATVQVDIILKLDNLGAWWLSSCGNQFFDQFGFGFFKKIQKDFLLFKPLYLRAYLSSSFSIPSERVYLI